MLPTMDTPPRDWGLRSREARRGFLAVVLVLAAVVAAASISSWYSARELASTVLRGQTTLVVHALRSTALDPDTPVDTALDRFLTDNASLGVRWVAIMGPEGVVASRGSTHAAAGLRPRGPEPLDVGEGLVRVGTPLLAPGGPGTPPGPPRPHPGPGPSDPDGHPRPRLGIPPPGPPDAGPGAHPRRRHAMIDFEPTLVSALDQRAQRDLAIGLLSALVLAVFGSVVAGLSRRAEDAETKLAHQRHLAALGEMSAVLAHELKNPLASLKGHAQLLEEQLEPQTRPRTKAKRVVDEAVRLQELIESLLTFVRSGGIERTDVDPRALVGRVRERTQPSRVVIVSDDAPPTWSLDGMRVEQVLINLVENGLDASGDRAPVTVRIGTRAGALHIEVRDRGSGIADEIRDQLFAPFKTTKTRGVGLGLAVAKRIVQSHGGTIEAHDHPEGGAVLEFTIPPK